MLSVVEAVETEMAALNGCERFIESYRGGCQQYRGGRLTIELCLNLIEEDVDNIRGGGLEGIASCWHLACCG